MNRAWSLLTIDDTRQYGGNKGYVDDPEVVYRYDSDVANHMSVKVGDVVVVRTRSKVLGIAEIATIREGTGQKDRLRCPECNETNIKRRYSKCPPWRCRQGHCFSEPVNEPVMVTTFEAHYAESFRSVPAELSIRQVNDAVLRPNFQMSIKELDLEVLEPLLDNRALSILRRYASRLLVPEELVARQHEDLQSAIAQRRRVLRTISERRGQLKFREKLIRRYGMQCQISRYQFAPALEAAHIRPYSKSEDNGVGNGILLRSDLHTLFDLGYIGINPRTLQVSFHPACLCAEYITYDGTRLFVNLTSGPDVPALAEHWEFYLHCLRADSGTSTGKCP